MSEDTNDQKPKLQLVTKEFIKNLTDNEVESIQNKFNINIDNLTDKDVKFLQERFNIDIEDASAAEQIARSFNVTRERIRQIEKKALRKLGKNPDDDGPSVA